MRIATILFISFFLAAISAHGQDKLEKKLDEYLSARFEPSQPGCQVLVAKHGKIIYKKAFGMADIQLEVPLKPDMVFNIASVTKQFTAVAILQLVEQGKISLQDSLQKFIPDFPSKGYTITIENLLTHTSGIRDYMQIDYRSQNMERWDFTPKQLIDSFKNYPLSFIPGDKFSYSNSGYYLLGYVIEKISGARYQRYIEDHLLKPLGLTHTYFDSSGIIVPKRVTGYRKDGQELKNVDYWSPTIEYAAGGLISNVDDLFAWNQGLFSYKVLKKETLEKAFKPFQLRDGTSTEYGYGWFLKTTSGIKSIEHEGGLPGFLSNEIYFPEQDLFIATLYNCGCFPVNELSVTISSIALGKPLQNEISVDPKILDDYAGVYRLTIDTARSITMVKQDGRLLAKVSDSETIPLLFQSETKFQFKNLLDAHCEFIRENGVITKFSVRQNGQFEWIKIR